MKRTLALLLVLMACGESLAPVSASPFDPPPYYAELWASVESCAHRSGDWHRIEWFRAPQHDFSTPINGLWTSPHRIYLAEERLTAAWLISHEMLHDLLQRGDHPTQFDACNLRTPVIPMGEL